MFVVGINNLAKIFNIHENTVRAWIRAGLPCQKKGRVYHFNLQQVIKWRDANVLHASREEEMSLTEARRRREMYRAELVRLQMEEKKGRLLDREKLFRMWVPVLQGIKAKLLGLPHKLTPLLVGHTEPGAVYDVLQKEIYQLLSELASLEPEAMQKTAAKQQKRSQKTSPEKKKKISTSI